MKKYLFILAIILVGCSSDNEGDNLLPEEEAMEEETVTENEEESSTNLPPISAPYLKPENNKACTGEETSDAQILVDFEWNSFEDDSDTALTYSLAVIDLSTNETLPVITTSDTFAQITLRKGITYEWTVSATDSSDAEVTGEVWQFQTPFDALVNYVPFPARLIGPENGDTLLNNEIRLIWEGNDPDQGETASLIYDVYLGTVTPPSLVSVQQNAQFFDVNLEAGTYYWKVDSIDVNNNVSSSQIHQFVVAE